MEISTKSSIWKLRNCNIKIIFSPLPIAFIFLWCSNLAWV